MIHSGDAGSARERRPSIQDVAREAGVSRAAVSKVIRNAYGVSDAMREKVTAAIAKLGYRPSPAARALRGASYTIGVEMPFLGNPFLAAIVDGAIDALEGSGYQVIVAPADDDPAEGFRAIEALADHGVDGIMTISPLVDPGWLEGLAARVPIVMLGRHDDSRGYDTVTADDVTGTRLMMDHLLGLGHRSILHLTRSEHITRSGNANPHALRLEGYLAAMDAAGLADRARVVRSGPNEADAYGVALEALTSGERPTAVFAGNDELALGVQRAAAELGLSPAELSISGYDDVTLARHPLVSLTTVAQPGREMGQRSMQLVRERIAGRTEPVHHDFPVELRVRDSTTSPPR